MKTLKRGFAVDRIEVEAFKYALKIINKIPKFTIDNAKKIFGKYYYLVDSYLKQMQQNRIEAEKESKVIRTVLVSEGASYWYSKLKTAKPIIDELKNIRHDMWLAEQEMLDADNFDDALRGLKKWEAGSVKKLAKRIELIGKLGDNNTNYLLEFQQLQKLKKSNNIKPAQAARLTDIDQYGYEDKIRELDESYIETKLMIQDQETVLSWSVENHLSELYEKYKERLRNGE